MNNMKTINFPTIVELFIEYMSIYQDVLERNFTETPVLELVGELILEDFIEYNANQTTAFKMVAIAHTLGGNLTRIPEDKLIQKLFDATINGHGVEDSVRLIEETL